MAAWFGNWNNTLLRQGKALLRDLKSEGNVALNDQIDRFKDLIPVEPTKLFWVPARRELGRMLRLNCITLDKAAMAAAASKGNGKDDKLGLGDDEDQPQPKKRPVRIDSAMTIDSMVEWYRNRSVTEVKILNAVGGEIEDKIDHQNTQRVKKGLSEYDGSTKIEDIIDTNWLAKEVAKLTANAIKDSRDSKTSQDKGGEVHAAL